MSAISIPPIKSKLRVTKRFEIECTRILNASANLEKAMYVVGKILILEEDSVFRIDGFVARATDCDYPEVKISVFPMNGKMGSVYVSLESLDGLTWDPITEKEIPVKNSSNKISRRFDVFLSRSEIDNTRVWHQAFNSPYVIDEKALVMINPLALKSDEIETGLFIKNDKVSIGNALCTVGMAKFKYELIVNIVSTFKTELLENGILGAKIESVKYELVAAPQYDRIASIMIQEIELGKTDIQKAVKDWLKERHKS